MTEAIEQDGQVTTVAAYQNTREERVAASRVVLQAARNQADLHDLCEALGLNTTSSKDT